MALKYKLRRATGRNAKEPQTPYKANLHKLKYTNALIKLRKGRYPRNFLLLGLNDLKLELKRTLKGKLFQLSTILLKKKNLRLEVLAEFFFKFSSSHVQFKWVKISKGRMIITTMEI